MWMKHELSVCVCVCVALTHALVLQHLQQFLDALVSCVQRLLLRLDANLKFLRDFLCGRIGGVVDVVACYEIVIVTC